MNCNESQQLLSRMLDHELAPGQNLLLAAHVQSCAACREFQLGLQGLSQDFKAEIDSIAVPNAAQEWKFLQSRLQSATQPLPDRRRRLPPLLWLGAPLAAAAALAFLFISPSDKPQARGPIPAEPLAAVTTQVDYVESGDPAAATMIYVDKQSGWLVVWATDPTNQDKG
ncbi:MAG: zf-HC2 domain-containing protein [Cephaloticoccus sp.]|nr:zf-HC2 domain-containing protein [Cephaloticoccus sp.]